MTNIALNSAARKNTKFADAPKIRVKAVDGTLFIRPTDRVSGVNLPKGEKLIELQNGKATVELDGVEIGAGSHGLVAGKYGWFAVTAGNTEASEQIRVA